jgi:hypothetical protein
VALRKPFWFEKFCWFVTSDNLLVVSGRDAQQNELLVKRYLRKDDLYVHADLHGAATTIVRNDTTGRPGAPCRPLLWAGACLASACQVLLLMYMWRITSRCLADRPACAASVRSANANLWGNQLLAAHIQWLLLSFCYLSSFRPAPFYLAILRSTDMTSCLRSNVDLLCVSQCRPAASPRLARRACAAVRPGMPRLSPAPGGFMQIR